MSSNTFATDKQRGLRPAFYEDPKPALSSDEQAFWDESFQRAAEVLMKVRNGRVRDGFSDIALDAATIADEALKQRRMRSAAATGPK